MKRELERRRAWNKMHVLAWSSELRRWLRGGESEISMAVTYAVAFFLAGDGKNYRRYDAKRAVRVLYATAPPGNLACIGSRCIAGPRI